jgi:ADP-heptose:LPS heptosyltransferase
MKILAIRFARLGDVILLLSSLTQLKASIPNCHLTLVTGHRCAPVAQLCPAIDDIISVDRVAMRDGSVVRAIGDIVGLVREIRSRRFDLVIDFHGLSETNLLTWLSRGRQRIALRLAGRSYLSFCFNVPPVAEDKTLHVSQMFRKLVDRVGSLSGAPAGIRGSALLKVPSDDLHWFRDTIQLRDTTDPCPLLVFYLDAPVESRIWPAERFAEIGDCMIERFGASVVALAGPAGDPLVRRFLASTRHPERVQAFSSLSISKVAAIVAAAQLFVSNDTGPMHLGPALGVLTLALFSEGFPEHFRPTGSRDRFLRGRPIETLVVKEVLQVVEEMWTTSCPDLRR